MNILVVGAGFAGATVARMLAEADHQITVIDSRDHVAGNAYDYINQYGIRVHKYGPHIFHTNNKKVYDWLNQFTTWIKLSIRSLDLTRIRCGVKPSKNSIPVF